MLIKNENYVIENTQLSDLPFIFSFFEEAIKYQKRNGYPLWNGYDKQVLKQDVESQNQYKIIIDGTIACLFSVLYSDKVIWGEREVGNAIYLHRVVVHPHSRGNSHFGRVLRWTIDKAKSMEAEYIRMDTWADNDKIISYYKSYGFTVVDSLFTSNSPNLPTQQRNNAIVLLQLDVN